MLNSGKKFQALRDKKINILTLVLSAEKEFLNETKNHNPTPPPCKLNGRSLIALIVVNVPYTTTTIVL